MFSSSMKTGQNLKNDQICTNWHSGSQPGTTRLTMEGTINSWEEICLKEESGRKIKQTNILNQSSGVVAACTEELLHSREFKQNFFD